MNMANVHIFFIVLKKVLSHMSEQQSDDEKGIENQFLFNSIANAILFHLFQYHTGPYTDVKNYNRVCGISYRPLL